MKKTHDIARGSDGARGRPLEFQHQHGLISHAARSTEDRLDRGVDRLDDTEADRMIAVRRDALDMLEQELPEPIHLGEPLPPQRVDPAIEEVQHARSRLVGPEAIELFPQDIRFEQAPIRGEEGLELGPLRAAHRLPAAQQDPPLAAPMLPHHRAGAEEFLAPHVIERGAGVLQNMEFVLW